jgi:hypothetical protein
LKDFSEATQQVGPDPRTTSPVHSSSSFQHPFCLLSPSPYSFWEEGHLERQLRQGEHTTIRRDAQTQSIRRLFSAQVSGSNCPAQQPPCGQLLIYCQVLLG